MNINDLVNMFFTELKQYNCSNFKLIDKMDLDCNDPRAYKSCSSVITRYFIFKEHHPEIPESSMNLLYYRLRIDQIARYFSEYPASNIEDLLPFQRELRIFTSDQQDTNKDVM